MSARPALERDLASFTDPATEAKVTEGAHGTRIQFTRNGSQLDYFLNPLDGSIAARHAEKRKYASLRSLLASSEFADIRGFATTQARMHKDFNTENLIQPEGEFDGKRLALQTLQRALVPHFQHVSEPKLKVLLLDGPAGVGKTLLIQRLLVQRARGQHDVGSAPPILHVTSRGRRLTALDEALAQSLQILRAQFTFDQVPTLIRHNLIQLAIDGFDELVDPEGYKDAWFALRDFFDITGFGGPIILAGRDTFFDEQSFSTQIAKSQHAFELNHVRLESVSPSSAKAWLATRGWKADDLSDSYTDLVLRPGSYALRPYFLNELAQAKSWQAIGSNDLTPRAYLVDRFVTREANLLGEKLSLSAEEVKNRLIGIFEEIAMEMADTETDAVDLSFLQMATEFAFGNSLNQTDIAKLRHKAGSFALLVSDAREGFRRFPHTEISHHFLAQALIRLVGSGAMVRFLRRGIVSSDFLAVFAEIVVSQPAAAAEAFVRNLESATAQEATFDRLPENAASLLITCLCRAIGEQRRHYHDFQVPNATIFGQAADSCWERLRIQRLDAEEASLIKVEFKECDVVNLFVDETTRFGKTVPKIHHLHLKSKKGVVRELYDPTEIESWLAGHSLRTVLPPTVNESALWLLDKVCRIMLRQHMIKDHQSDVSGHVLRHRYWPPIESILREAGLIDRIRGKQMAGAPAPFLRMHDPYSLLANRSAPKIRDVWKRVGSIPA